MAKKKRTLSQSKAELTFNLKEWFGADFTGRFDLKEEIANDVVQTILKRTESSKDVNGASFKGYSPEYKKSLAFKAFGKTSKVNLELTGQMLGTLDLIDTAENTLTIGWTDDTEIKKAYHHNVGKEGDADNWLPKREFFDLNEKEMEIIKQKYDSIIDEELTPNAETRSILRQIQSTRNNMPLDIRFDLGEEDEE